VMDQAWPSKARSRPLGGASPQIKELRVESDGMSHENSDLLRVRDSHGYAPGRGDEPCPMGHRASQVGNEVNQGKYEVSGHWSRCKLPLVSWLLLRHYGSNARTTSIRCGIRTSRFIPLDADGDERPISPIWLAGSDPIRGG
jgi:hypothetical protein